LQDDGADEDKESEEPESNGQEEQPQDREEAAQESRVAAALLEAETTEMDLGVVLSAAESAAAVQMAEEHGVTLAAVAPAPASPPRSGWDMDESSEDELEEVDMGSVESASGDLALTRMARPASPPTTVAPSALSLSFQGHGVDASVAQHVGDEQSSPLFDAEPVTDSQHSVLHGQPSSLFESSGYAFNDSPFGTMDVDAESQDTESSPFGTQRDEDAGLDLGHGGDLSGDGHSVIAIDEDSLSALEKIFVCAKSDHANERSVALSEVP
jgi:hypothetical protein